MACWETSANPHSFRQQCRQLLGNYFRSFQTAGPWYLSIGNPVDGVHKTCLAAFLGYDFEVGVDFLCSLGLLKRGHGRYPNAVTVLLAEWDKFIIEQELGDIMETITRTQVGDKMHYFINYGNKSLLTHIPAAQFNGEKEGPSRIVDLPLRQHRFHRKVSQLMTVQLSSSKVALKNEEAVVFDNEESVCSESESCCEDTQPTPTCIFGSSVTLSSKDTPCLWKLFGGQLNVPKGYLSQILLELFAVLGSKASVDFQYKNGNKGRAIIVPKVRDEESFRSQARKLKWVESMLDHVSDRNDAAQWLSIYLGRHFEGSFTIALDALGLPVVQQLDEKSTAAMWADANINYTQQRIIKRHLRLHLGKRLFIPETRFSSDHEHYFVPTYYNEYKYYKNGDKSQKPERCHYWCRDPSIVVGKEFSRMLDYLDPNLIPTRFNSLITSGSCTLIAGADQGQGAWRSWIKVSTMSGEEVRNKMSTEESFNLKSSYIIAQVAHITCKKDHPDILSATVSGRISEGYDKLLSQRIVFVKPASSDAKVEAIMVPRDATNIKMQENSTDKNKCNLSYEISSPSFIMTQQDETSFPKGSKVILILPPFSLYITGDLSYYADVLGMPNSSSYWCPWCLLSHSEWNRSPETFTVEERTIEFLTNMAAAVKNDTQRRLKPIERKGVTCDRHYSSLGPKNFVPPLLHLEMGMVNQAFDSFEDWVDDKVEVIPPAEKEARKELINAIEKHDLAIEEKKEVEGTTGIEIRQKNGTLNLIKAQLRRTYLSAAQRTELNVQLTLVDTFISDLKKQQKLAKDKVKDCQTSLSNARKKLATLREERGKPEASISAEIDMILDKYNASRAAYHGGDFNGVSCRRIVGNSDEIVKEIQKILHMKKDETCTDEMIDEKVKQLELTLGLLDAAFYYLNIVHPTADEKEKASQAVSALSRHWRDIGLSITLKAHVMEQHSVPFNNDIGLGDKEESFIEAGHQIGLKENRRYQGLTNFQKKMEASLKARAISTHPLIIQHNDSVYERTRRKFSESIPNEKKEPGKKRVKREAEKEEKEQKKTKRENYVQKFMENQGENT